MKRRSHRLLVPALFPLLALVACGGDAEPPSVAPVAIATAAPSPDAGVARPPVASAADAGSMQNTPNGLDIGTSALFADLRSIDPKGPRQRVNLETKRILDQIGAIADPRSADGLIAYIESNPPPHWKTEAVLHLAELGDLRAGPYLGWRLAQNPQKLYDAAVDPEWRMDDNERVRAARMLADLATMYPSSRAALRSDAELAAYNWVYGKPQPHANGLRFLAAVESTMVGPKLREWAEPKNPLPAKGMSEFPESFATAQVALRYLGRIHDPQAFAILQRQLGRRPRATDATMEAAMAGGVAVHVMALRALTSGAAQGLAELGDPRATVLLVKLIEDQKENEQARLEACFALPWVASDAELAGIALKVAPLSRGGDKEKVVAQCYLEGLARSNSKAASHELVKVLGALDPTTRSAAARTIGLIGVPADVTPVLTTMLTDASLRDDAALALLLGGTSADANSALSGPAGHSEALQLAYARAFGFFSDLSYDRGQIARWAENADACSDLGWPVLALSHALRGIEYDNGPHSLTRVLLRHRLVEDAKSGSPVQKRQATLVLDLAREKGALASLGVAARTLSD